MPMKYRLSNCLLIKVCPRHRPNTKATSAAQKASTSSFKVVVLILSTLIHLSSFLGHPETDSANVRSATFTYYT